MYNLCLHHQVMSAREKKAQIDDCSKLTEHLLPVLPKLLSKVFSPHIIVIVIFVSITLYGEHPHLCTAQPLMFFGVYAVFR